MNNLIDVYLEGASKNPVKMTRDRYIHPSLNKGEYVRLFMDSKSGLVFDKDNYLIGLWTVGNIV